MLRVKVKEIKKRTFMEKNFNKWKDLNPQSDDNTAVKQLCNKS